MVFGAVLVLVMLFSPHGILKLELPAFVAGRLGTRAPPEAP